MEHGLLPILSPFDLPEAVDPADLSLDRTRKRLPAWLKVSLPVGESRARFEFTTGQVHGNILHTVCEEARCPNIHDCWGRGTATFMVAGKDCTRGCKFCAVDTNRTPDPLDQAEPARLAEAVARMKLDHVVVTVVNRDDLPDGAAGHYRACVEAIHDASPSTNIELLCSDLAGNLDALELLLLGTGSYSSGNRGLSPVPLGVFAHNVECVPRLDRVVRDPRASFHQSLTILERAVKLRPDVAIKSSLMVGVGETDAEVHDAMARLRGVGVELLTIGQYLQPSPKHLPVDRFVPPDTFAAWEAEALSMGFAGCASGPMVRSSYRAEELLARAMLEKRRNAVGAGTPAASNG